MVNLLCTKHGRAGGINISCCGTLIHTTRSCVCANRKGYKKKEIITNPEEYLEIFKQHGTVFKLGSEDVPAQDWKSASLKNIKPPGQWHFQFNMSKKFVLKRSTKHKSSVVVRGEQAYKSDTGMFKLITKTGRTAKMINPHQLITGVAPNKLKLKDVNKLLEKHYGKNWKELEPLGYYNKIFEKYCTETIPEGKDAFAEEDPSNELCEIVPTIPDVLI